MEKINVFVYSLILVILFATAVNAVEITPKTIHINLTGGDIVFRNITISNSESYPVNCKLSTTMLPDDAGINVTYKYSNFNITSALQIPAHTSYQIEMRIKTSLALKPDSYTIKTKFEFINQEKISVASSTDNSDGFRFYYVDTPNETYIADNILLEENKTVTDDKNTTTIPDTKTPTRFPYLEVITIITGFALLLVITLLYIISKKRRNKKEKEKWKEKPWKLV